MKKLLVLLMVFSIGCSSLQHYQIAVKLKDGSTVYYRKGKISVNKYNIWIKTKNGWAKYKVKNIDALLILDKNKKIVVENNEYISKEKNPCKKILEQYMEKFETK